MVSYENTSEYYSGMSTMVTYGEYFPDSNVHSYQDHTNYQMHLFSPENDGQGFYYPVLSTEGSTFDPIQNQINQADAIFYENNFVPQHNSIQYTPLTPEPVSYPVFHFEARPHQNNNMTAKRHCAQITILPSSKGNFKTVVKRKRKRTVFTTEQKEALEEIFKTKQYISREDRQVIVKKLQLNDKAVKIWFQNRRLKTKRMQDQLLEEQDDGSNISNTDERSSPDIARLDSVESQISKKTDEFGYVTLDNRVMGDLANVIDEFLTDSNLVPVEDTARNDITPVYEPISPASISDGNEENTSCWRPSEPNESLQRLFDLQTMLSL